ncbi:MAG: ABC transporter substrate-binding protein [Alphaproteobacteria bacterium]|nr:ABC transporter substrate-binding protein [Alphaproteobacteria bacterium]
MTDLTTLGRRGLLTGAAAACTLIRVRDARAQAAMTYVAPFSYIMAFADVLHAQAGGFFEREGLNVTIEQARGSAMAVQQVVGNNALLSRTGGVDHIKAVLGQNAPLVSVGTIAQASPFFVISHADKPIRSAADMKGKTIGILSQGGATDNLLDIMLVQAGLTKDDVKKELAGNSPAGFALIERGRIDAYITSVGPVVALREQGAKAVFWNTDDHAPVPGQCYIATREAAAKSPETVVKFLRAVRKSAEDMFADADLSRTLQRLEKFEIAEMKDRKVAALILKEDMKGWISRGRENILRNGVAEWAKAVEIMAKVGIVPAGDPSRLYTNEYVDVALKS